VLKKYYSDKRYKIKNSFSNIRKKLADKEEENKMERIIKKFPSLKKQVLPFNKPTKVAGSSKAELVLVSPLYKSLCPTPILAEGIKVDFSG